MQCGFMSIGVCQDSTRHFTSMRWKPYIAPIMLVEPSILRQIFVYHGKIANAPRMQDTFHSAKRVQQASLGMPIWSSMHKIPVLLDLSKFWFVQWDSCLKSKHTYVITAFLCSTLWEDEKFYAEMPLGFKQCGSNGKLKVLHFKKTLYGLH